MALNSVPNACIMLLFVLTLSNLSFSSIVVAKKVFRNRLSRSTSHRKHRSTSDNYEKSVTLHLQGIPLESGTFIAFTREQGLQGRPCDESFFLAKDIAVTSLDGSSSEIEVNSSLQKLLNTSWNLCIFDPSKGARAWIHLGKYETIPSSTLAKQTADPPVHSNVIGLRAEGDRVYTTEEGLTQIPANVNVTIRIFGLNFSSTLELGFTGTSLSAGKDCSSLPLARVVNITEKHKLSNHMIKLEVSLPVLEDGEGYFICIKDYNATETRWIHQGDQVWLKLEPMGRLLPMWIQMCVICLLLVLSGLFSGLNLGLMALDKTELQVIENCGTETEKKYAHIISPLRKRGNYLLCSLLLGNVLVNSTLTILLDDLTSGIVAIIGSTISIVVFGEIIPQAICSRHGLAIGAKTVYVTKFFMLATFPLSFPISKILDCVLGEEIGNVYDRERLMEFIRVTKDYNKLENEEVNIISGALELKTKTVANVMTQIDDVFMVPYNAILNFETMSEIMKQGYSRIPVYDGDRNNVVALLNIKDLAFVDPDDNSPLKTLCEFYNHPINYVFEDETLDVMLNEFKKGRSHMAFVRHINNEGDGDPFYEIIGVVTLEDVIEEILQSEIIDETDILTDNRKKQRRKEAQVKQDFSDFAKLGGGHKGTNIITPQLALATYQYLSTSVEPFKNKYLSETVLKRLMTQNIFFKSKHAKESYNASNETLFQAGKPADYFILILEGRCQVTVSKEKLVFETGPFSYFGIPAITVNINSVDSSSQQHLSLTSLSPGSENPASKTFIPDYSVVTITETLYMKIHWTVYLAAYRATLMERHHRLDLENDEIFDNYWDNGIQFPSSDMLSSSQAENSNGLVTQSKKNGHSPNGSQTSVVRIPNERDTCTTSFEVSNLSPDEVEYVPFNQKRGESTKAIVSNKSEIPLTEMPINLNVVFKDSNGPEAGDSHHVGKNLKDNVCVKKKLSLNGTSDQTNERTRLLYPSEA